MIHPDHKQTAQAETLKHRIWLRLRRWAFRLHTMASSSVAVGPVSFLLTAFALGIAVTVTTLYSTSYAVTVDGNLLGVVAEQETVTDAMDRVEARGTRLLGTEFQLEDNVEYDFTLSLKRDLTEPKVFENYFYTQLDQVSADLRMYEVLVDGESMGVVKDQTTLNDMFDELHSQYVTEHTVSADFVENVVVRPVYECDSISTVSEIQEKMEENTTGETTYTVVGGDTFNAIAHANDMAISDLKALNPDVNINRLMIGDVLNVKEHIPRVSVETVEEVTYHEAIPCPVEKVEDASMYEGDTKVLVQGTEGDSLVVATVTYVNGVEKDREVHSSTTLREPTTTTMAVGTKERPKTASKGYYIWPCSGRITSYFGGRHIFGSYSYHGGIDIKASYGQAIKAADGGTVTFSGWKGTYGNLVIIKHDNGTQTYYGHNSSLLVSAGDKVYQGQTIAKAGSTGRSTGVHCHFEIRVNGTAVNPLNYLS